MKTAIPVFIEGKMSKTMLFNINFKWNSAKLVWIVSSGKFNGSSVINIEQFGVPSFFYVEKVTKNKKKFFFMISMLTDSIEIEYNVWFTVW